MKRPLLTGLFAVAALSGTSAFADATKSQLYKDLVAPVLTAKCNNCHGTEKPKGKLSLVSIEAILKGGNEGAAVVAGKVDESPLLQRVYLPLNDDEHMPPEDKEQLTEQETALLAFWVASGAKPTGTVADFKPDAKALAAANHVLANLPKPKEGAVAKADAPKVDPAMEKLVKETIGRVEKSGASLMAIAQDTPELRFSALNVSKEFNDDKLAELKPIGSQIKWMDLARTQVTDKGLAHVAGMPNLTRLHLENTQVGDAGLDAIKGLAQLEYLNLYGTQVTDAGIAKLAGLKNLKKLFVWQSKVTDAGAAKLAAAIPGIDINTGWKEPQAQPAALAANTAAKPAAPAAPAPAPAKPATPTTPAPAPAKPATPAPAPTTPAKPATPAPAPAPAPKPATTTPAPAPAAAAKPAVDPMFQKAVTEVEAAATEAAKRAAQAKADFDAAIKAVDEATKRAEALKTSSEKAAAVAAETKAALDQLKKAVETSKK
jgi:hypothetical protein